MASFIDVVYENEDRQISWRGVKMADCDDFDTFMSEDVASRLYDEEEETEFQMHLRGLGNTDFAHESLAAILAADAGESDTWAVGEAVAEAFLSCEHGIVWPWNMNRDKRNPKASLAGADLVGFRVEGAKVRFAFGEVKSSSDPKRPPGVMKGHNGMTNQIKNLAKNSSLISGLIRWLYSRCKNSPDKELFDSAFRLFINSGREAISLYGVLIRDTQPGEKDLRNSGRKLAEVIESPVACYLFAVYVPCSIADFPCRVGGGGL